MNLNSDLLKDLETFGLSEYESKAFTALVSAGKASSVTEISQICDVPRSNLYSVLEKLNKKGLVEIQEGRPQLFKALKPEKSLAEIEREKKNNLEEAKDSALEKLSNLRGEEKTETIPALVWGVKGYDSVVKKMEGMIERAKKQILVNSPDVDLFKEELYSNLKKAKEKGVKIKISTEEEEDYEDLRDIAMVRTREKIHGIDLVADEEEVLIAPKLPAVGVWVDNPEMAQHVKNFLDVIWKDSKILKNPNRGGSDE